MTNSINIQIFLSYRHKNTEDIKARDRLKQLCADQALTLTYDEEATEEGDNLIAFMNDLSAARCVFLFLSPAYFQSAYCLYELVSIHEQNDLEQRLIQPIRATADMVTYQWTQAKQFWKKNEAIRNELARLLGEQNHDALWQRIDTAWTAIIFHHLDELHRSLEESDGATVLEEKVHAIQTTVKTVIEDKT